MEDLTLAQIQASLFNEDLKLNSQRQEIAMVAVNQSPAQICWFCLRYDQQANHSSEDCRKLKNKKQVVCRKCSNTGHYDFECRSKIGSKNKNGNKGHRKPQAYVATQESKQGEEEPLNFFAHVATMGSEESDSWVLKPKLKIFTIEKLLF